MSVSASAISADDIVHWPYTFGLLVKWVAFLVPCIGLVDWILRSVACPLWSCLFFMSSGLVRGCLWRRLILGIFDQGVSAVPFGPGIDIWRSCRFIGDMMRSLCLLPGVLGRFCARRYARAQLAGTLLRRYCAPRFASGAPGHVASLVTADLGVVESDGAEGASREVVSGFGPGWKRIRLDRKKPCPPRGFRCSISATSVE